MLGLQSERKPIVVAAPAENPILAIAKDWLAGGTAAGVSKTLVAPIGTLPHLSHGAALLFFIFTLVSAH